MMFHRILNLPTCLKSGYSTVSVVNVDQVPPDFREVAILGGYRTPINSPSQCIASVFYATNETLNFWTHFLPSCYFIYRLSQFLKLRNFTQDEFSLPFLCYMIIICMYPLISCVAHVFSSLSSKARHICYFCDYAALSMYSYGAAIVYRTYSLPDQLLVAGLADVHLLSCFLSSAASTLFACFSRLTSNMTYLRVTAFALPYFCSGMPIIYRVMNCIEQGDSCIMPSFLHHVKQFLATFVGTFAYTTHLPERIWPGRFDIVGHSHQWLHICSILTTNEQIVATLLDMQYRRSHIMAIEWMPTTHLWICGSVVILVAWDAIVVTLFSFLVLKKERAKAL